MRRDLCFGTLAPGGGLAAAIPHYEDRPSQRVMADAVARALADDETLLVEAGTGTGKTLAYLIPALESGKRVVVSTGTRALQDQIARADLPLLAELLPRPFSAVTLKGVSNYLCLRRLRDLELGGNRALDARDRGDLDAIADWAHVTEIGDRAEVDGMATTAPVWAKVTTTPETRLGPKCPFFESCFVTRARRRAEKADLVLVNHHLFFADLALRRAFPGARVLPDYDAVIFDEAHQLEDVITEHFSIRVSAARLEAFVRDARDALGGAGLLARDRAAARMCDHADASARWFFDTVAAALPRRARREGRVELAADLFAGGDAQERWFRLDNAVWDLGRHAAASAADDPDDDSAAGAVARRAAALRDDLAALAEQSEERYVYWAEHRAAGLSLSAAPIDVAGLATEHLGETASSVVLTSATLRVGGTFEFVRGRLGLTEACELAVTSPFDYASQALLYVPRDLPLPGERGAGEAACARAAELCAITGGRAFVLFTSHRALNAAARALRGALPFPVLVQGDAPRAALLERFRARPGSVLLGTGSFWEGVDVPGDALSLVVIDKLPFAPHTDPLVAARGRAVEAAGGEAFADYQLPRAALALEQGFGRLIRRSDDRGVVAVLDPRLVTRRYGEVFVRSLPDGLPRTSSLERVRRWWLS